MEARRIYAGIGSRETPEHVLVVMQEAARLLAAKKWTLRSGGAPGADSAFERGCDEGKGEKEIFLPWPRYENHTSTLVTVTDAQLKLAARFHPAWSKLSRAGRKLHGRNCAQILGRDLQTPARIVLCWTPGGEIEGGTGQALRIAESRGVTVINLGGNWMVPPTGADVAALAEMLT